MDVVNKSEVCGGPAPRVVVGTIILALVLANGAGAEVISGDDDGASGISFTDPTPTGGATLAQNYVYVNTIVSNGVTAFINWNNTLVGWWRFNGESGEDTAFFKDWSGMENDADCSGTNCPAFVSGKFGNALSFDGVDDYIDAGKGENLNIEDAITIEAWINPAVAQEKCWDEESGNYGIMSKTSDPENSTTWSWQLRYGAPGGGCYLGFQFNGDPEGNRWVTVDQNLAPGEWYHIAGTFDGNEIYSYLNGNLVETNKISAIKGYNNKLIIGSDGWNNYFNGTIDEVRIHRRALSPEEIKASYSAGNGRLYRNFTDLAMGSYNYQAYSQNLQGSVYQTKKRTVSLIPENSDDGETIKVAGFNVKVFNEIKASNPEVMNVLSNIIRNYDVIALQETTDTSNTAVSMLRDSVNSIGGTQYNYIASERLGKTTRKEAYVYFYNTKTIDLVGNPYVFPDPEDLFERPPFIANFKTMNGNFDFIAINIHAKPENATQEIDDLPKAVEDAKSRYPEEGDLIIIGDPNADCSYFDENGDSPLKSSDYLWIIDNSIDTSATALNCTYDRIILTSPAITDFTGNSGVFKFNEAYNLNYDNTLAVSDHYPVYAEFWNNKDDD